MSSHQVLATALLSSALACAGADRRRGEPRRVTAVQVRAEINTYVCGAWSDEAQQWSAEFLADTCRAAAAETDLARAIKRVVLRAQAVVPLGKAAYEYFYGAVGRHPREEQQAASGLAREAFWYDPVLAQAIWIGVCLELRNAGLSCDHCETVAAPRAVELSWDKFAPYLAAFVWPTRRDDGTGVEIFVCSEVNGVGNLPGDRTLAHAGFLAAAGLAEDPEIGARIQGLAQRYREPTPDLSAVFEEIGSLVGSPAGRSRACSALARTEWFTGVSVSDCP